MVILGWQANHVVYGQVDNSCNDACLYNNNNTLRNQPIHLLIDQWWIYFNEGVLEP